MNRSTLALQVAAGIAILFVAAVAAFRFLEWLFAGNVVLWAAFLILPGVMALGVVVVDIASERTSE